MVLLQCDSGAKGVTIGDSQLGNALTGEKHSRGNPELLVSGPLVP